jgi:DNA (cytosine-5)-methyltransferase 1
MNYLSVCSGIEAATVAWHHMGWKPVGFSEIEKFPSQVLAHHYPQVTNFGDMTKYKEWEIDRTIGLLVVGTPCQSFSVAGLRKGLSDPRGNLALTYVGILDHFRPKWFIWENVPGVLSSNQGRDFASFLTALGIIGYGWSYRVLDAQYFGVAQRRRRVFVIGHLGDWRPTAEVLFESESLQRNTNASRKKQEKITPTIAGSTCSGKQKFGTLMANCGTKLWLGNQEAFSGDFHVFAKQVAFDGRNIRDFSNGNFDTFPTLTASDYKMPKMVCYENNLQKAVGFTQCDAARDVGDNISPTLRSGGNGGYPAHSVATNMAVRRLTPVECERLQGFPNNYTNIRENCPDGARYKALGNSMAVPVMRWIGERINSYETMRSSAVVQVETGVGLAEV